MRSAWMDRRVAVAGLVLANAIPLIGVAFYGWTLHSLLVIYWLESGVVGLESVAKILRAEGEDDVEALPSMSFNERSVGSLVGESNRAIAGFFAGHYGAFWLVHGIFVVVFGVAFPAMGFVSARVVGLALLGLVAYHALSYRVNYVGYREFERNGPVTLMIEPYRRVLVLHLTIVGGGFLIGGLGGPVGAVVLMVLVKTALDLRGHWRVHERAQRRIPGVTAAE